MIDSLPFRKCFSFHFFVIYFIFIIIVYDLFFDDYHLYFKIRFIIYSSFSFFFYIAISIITINFIKIWISSIKLE